MRQRLRIFFTGKNALLFFIFSLIVYAFAEKIILFTEFSIKYTDEDQCIQWLAADELMHGHFREPCFFGQDYNSCLEGWLSIPFLVMGLQFSEAIPLTTLLMSCLPFLLLIIFFLKKKEYALTVVILFFFLYFSLNYKLISILPRGFITGVFCFGIGYAFLLRNTKYRFFWFSFFAFFGIVFNETTFFLMFPVFCIYWKQNYRLKQFYLQGFLGSTIPLVYKIYAYVFYNVTHPKYKYFTKPKFQWDFKNLSSAVSHLDEWLFNDFTLIFISFIVLVCLFIFKKQYFNLCIVVVTFVLITMMFGLVRTLEGTESIMFNKSRLFVFFPFLLAVLFSIIIPAFKLNLKAQSFISLALFILVSIRCFGQQNRLEHKITEEVLRNDKIVSFLPVKDVFKLSYKYIYICKATHNTIILYDAMKQENFILYITIPLLSGNKIKTFSPTFDRRLWVFSSLINTQPEKVLISGNFKDRYNNKRLNSYKRRIIFANDENWLVEYKLNKTIGNTCKDFTLRLRGY